MAESSTQTPQVAVFGERTVPLGGLRGVDVQRSLPRRELYRVGAWCFLDRFGPTVEPMRMLPHPHIGLQTVTYLYAGTLRHRDSLGNDVIVKPGDIDIMTAGWGISHSEYSIDSDGTTPKDLLSAPAAGLQFWVALPDAVRNAPASFERHLDLPSLSDGPVAVRVLVGEFAGLTSPATVHTPLVGVDVGLDEAGTFHLPLEPEFEYAALLTEGAAALEGARAGVGNLVSLGRGREHCQIEVDQPTRLLLMGGLPLEEDLVMWWNFLARSHEEIVQARRDWQDATGRFGQVAGHGALRVPAPSLPGVRLLPRPART